MPVTRFQMKDGRVARFEIPDGTTPEQAQSMVSQYLARSQPTQNWRNDPIVALPKRSKAAWENDPIISPAPKAQGRYVIEEDEPAEMVATKRYVIEDSPDEPEAAPKIMGKGEMKPWEEYQQAALQPERGPWEDYAQAQPAPKQKREPTQAERVRQQDKNVLGGLVRGAGSLGSTLVYPYDRIKGGSAEEGLRLNRERRAAIDAGLQELIGSNPDSAGYKTGKVMAEIGGTAGVGNVFAKGVQYLPMLSRAVPNLAPALQSGGFSVAQKATTPLGMVGNAAIRTAAGGATGAGMAGLVNPEDVGTGALYGAAMPGVFKLGGEAGMALSRGGKAASRRLMQSALKPTIKQLKTGDARVAVDTLLDYGINPNKRGVERLRGTVDNINDDIAARIAGSNATVSRQKALDCLADVRAKAGNQVSPAADVGAIQGIADDFLNHPNIASDAIPVQQAQELKKGTYQALRGQYGQVRGSAIEAQKAVARGLKDQIAEVVPGIGPLNAEEARLLKTLDVAERRALMEMNKNPMGLSILAGNKAAFVGFMADRSAAFKALAARAINRASVAPTYATTLADQLANPMLRGGLLSIGAHPHLGQPSGLLDHDPE